MYRVDNAIIMAAGVSSRFAPLSYEMPKALIEVKGEVMIERQIRQLQEAGVCEIFIVVGYMAEKFEYLREKYGVRLILNAAYAERNNHSSIYAAKDVICSTYICSGDNYFLNNPFESCVDESYYAGLFSPNETKEWCMHADASGYIDRVEIGGRDCWYMLGHAFWSERFSACFLRFLENEYDLPQTKSMFWEDIFVRHLDELKMCIRKYPDGYIREFDSLDELRAFDKSYVANTRSPILRRIAWQLHGNEEEIRLITPIYGTRTEAEGISFLFRDRTYRYYYGRGSVEVWNV